MRLGAALLRPTLLSLSLSHLPSLPRFPFTPPRLRTLRHSVEHLAAAAAAAARHSHPTSMPFSTAPQAADALPPPRAQPKAARRPRPRDTPEGFLKHQLDMCSRDGDLATALGLYDSALSSSIRLTLQHFNCLLYLCSTAATSSDAAAAAAAIDRGFEIFAKMEADAVEPNESTLTSVARLAAARRDPALAFSVVKRMAEVGVPPRLRTYGPALFGYCEAGDAEGAHEVEAHMDAAGVVPEEAELAALLRVNVEKGRGQDVYRVLHRMRALVRQVSEATAEVVERWFISDTAEEVGVEKWDVRKVKEGVVRGGGGWHGQGWLGKGPWSVGWSKVDAEGTCQRCGERLVCIDIDPSETKAFAESVATLASQREAKAFLAFKEWLHHHGPFDAVIDAANVGLNNKKNFSFNQVNTVAKGIQKITGSKKLPLIILHRSRVKGGPADVPRNQKLIEEWRRCGALYSSPPGSNDDWYWLYAAVSCRSLIVTNDEMRDHLFELLGTSFFPRWKEKHQVRLTFSEQGPTYHLPPPYSIVIQGLFEELELLQKSYKLQLPAVIGLDCFPQFLRRVVSRSNFLVIQGLTVWESEGGSWHVPTTTGDDIEKPRQWICATRVRRQTSRESSQSLPRLSKRRC